jgi:hypothetical protein
LIWNFKFSHCWIYNILLFCTIPWTVFNPSAIVFAVSPNDVADKKSAALFAIGVTVFIILHAASKSLLTLMLKFLSPKFSLYWLKSSRNQVSFWYFIRIKV